MNRGILAALLVASVFLGSSDIAQAQGGGAPNLTPDSVTLELKSIGKMLLAAVFLVFLILGGYTIVQGLIDAWKNGGWSHVVMGIAVVFISGLAIWILSSLFGQDPEQISNTIKVDK